ncbi:hypothetical protein PC129_g3157 [Phytophthora cactorum]|uniref:Uncharacterized protein n=2 Tax=Phytophthora cactorum TaxID=29920 RepID=A0A8T1GEH1_9STRA|nr:hypothetical protein PC112_g5445 [Phytophthora cactorum]KAG3170805.1 hypothetical protein PI126_g2160 [Phytophthora idaei]KAG2838961.1 hypothetical protein PC111_g4050 [Phytophthora cactorum]KAG2863769.1 hypothetical protein PC113_g5150 [Phytophthora cactorum]KAG2921707.1 hypothetical protein PC114_g5582 [Phytophthora cactorum]
MSSKLSGDSLTRLQVTYYYEPETHTYAKAKADAVKLYDAGESHWGMDETTFVRILFSSPREHFVLVNDIYKKKYVSDFEEAVRCCAFRGYATEALPVTSATKLASSALYRTICSATTIVSLPARHWPH